MVGPATPFYRSPAHPRNAVHTLRRIPLASSRTASLRPLPSCCFRGSLHHSRTRQGVFVLPRPKSVLCSVRGLPHSRRPFRRSGRASLRRALAIELDARCPSYPLRPAPKRDEPRTRFEARPQSGLLTVTSRPRPLARPEGRARRLDTRRSLKLQDPHLAVALLQPIANGLTCARPNRQADPGQLMTLASSPRGDSDRRQRAPACLRLREPCTRHDPIQPPTRGGGRTRSHSLRRRNGETVVATTGPRPGACCRPPECPVCRVSTSRTPGSLPSVPSISRRSNQLAPTFTTVPLGPAAAPSARLLLRRAASMTLESVNFRALLHRRVRSARGRFQHRAPYPSMGFVPLQGHPIAAAAVPCLRGINRTVTGAIDHDACPIRDEDTASGQSRRPFPRTLQADLEGTNARLRLSGGWS
jgi:hypothetical protein